MPPPNLSQPGQPKWILPRARGDQPQEASIGSLIGPPVAEIFHFMYSRRTSPVKMACCGVNSTAGSPGLPILASQWYGQLVALYHCVAKPVRMRYHHRELFATMGDFDDGGVEQNRRVQIFWGTSITTYFKKKHVEHYIVFFEASVVFLSMQPLS